MHSVRQRQCARCCLASDAAVSQLPLKLQFALCCSLAVLEMEVVRIEAGLNSVAQSQMTETKFSVPE